MQELRKDPIVGRWVIMAPERAERPQEYHQEVTRPASGFCPFCEGHESATPPEILAYRNPHSGANQPGWRVRVVPNKFPALKVEGQLEKRGEGVYDVMSAVGAHEVIIESPQHEAALDRLPVENIREVLWAYRDRLVDLKRDRRLVHGLIFKNVGAQAGASLEHTHSQLIVTPVVPITVWEEMNGSLEFYKYRGRCIYCDIVRQETAFDRRLVLETPGFAVFCPFASRFPFETWIVPKRHASHYEAVSRQTADELGTVLKTVLGKLETALDRPAYNYIIHSAPFDSHDLPHYHWHLEIFPRITRLAGFEWGSGFYINPVLPENAAEFLRKVEG